VQPLGVHIRQPDVHPLVQRVDELHASLSRRNPHVLAERTGARYHPLLEDRRGEFRLEVWGAEVALSFPEFVAREVGTGQPLSVVDQALLAYYFDLADGAPLADRWIAFSELPEGRFYTQAFQDYTGEVLAKAFGDDLGAFGRVATGLGSRRESLGDAAYAFTVFPRVALLVACWLGDEDFPTSYKLLFDASASHYLTTDACAIMGSGLTRRLLKQRSEVKHNETGD